MLLGVGINTWTVEGLDGSVMLMENFLLKDSNDFLNFIMKSQPGLCKQAWLPRSLIKLKFIVMGCQM